MKSRLVLFTLLLILFGCATREKFKGLDLDNEPAPNFELTDQHGERVALADLRGNVVALTFLYTHCADVCPLIVSKLERANADLGDGARQVKYVAISVDPEHDTPIAIQIFLQHFAMEDKVLYLNGTRDQLQPVWKSYYIDTIINEPPSAQVEHISRVVLIDRTGRERVHFSPDFAPDDLVHDLKLLIGE